MASPLHYRVFCCDPNGGGPNGGDVTRFYTATAPDFTLDAWNAEIRTLPTRKLKHWKSVLVDPYGIRCQVRFSEAPIPIGPDAFSHFQERISTQAATSSGLPTGTWVPVQSVSQRAGVHRHSETIGVQLCGASSPEDDDAHVRAAVAEVSAHSTGNHRPRRHRVSVPTAAGEPVRG